MSPLFGAIEAGGTKFVCAVGTHPDDIRAQVRIDTDTPEVTLSEVCSFFEDAATEHGALAAIGVGCFGPVDLEQTSPTYGYITSTPKPGWANIDIVGHLIEAFGLPVGFDTDVNAAALGEARWGAGVGLHSLLYLTVGTGIGGGAIADGRILHGRMHPEMGHIPIPHDRDQDPYEGCCPYHGDCLEGLASGPALRHRWGIAANQLPPEHDAWALEAMYLGTALATFILTLSPQRIILGGGVMEQRQLFARVRHETARALEGYLRLPELHDEGLDAYITAPGLGQNAGISGALALAESAVA
ncbi:MAG: ROK family protein [bacterium]|nr:ROK family protein [bacterium]